MSWIQVPGMSIARHRLLVLTVFFNYSAGVHIRGFYVYFYDDY